MAECPLLAHSGHANCVLVYPPLDQRADKPNSVGGVVVTERKDVWASGDAYEPYVGRWSRLIARQFIAWLRVPRAFARHKVTNPRATFQVGDAQNLPVADNSFDATVAGLSYKFHS